MSVLDFFRRPDGSRDNRMVTDSLEEIIRRVGEQSGIDRCIRFEDGVRVAFSGTPEDCALCLTLSVSRSEGWDYLIADLDGEMNWCEWDFDDRFEFFDTVSDYIASHMNRRFRLVTEMVRHKGIRIREYILDEQGNWQLFSEDQVDGRLVRMFVKKNERTEVEREYKI